MNISQRVAALLPCLFLCGCFYTPDSLQVFDRDQARELIEESGFIPAGQQQILLKLPRGSTSWKKINRPGTGIGFTISYAPKDANEKTWHELIERKLIPYGTPTQRSARSVTEAEIQLMRNPCEQVNAKILATTPQYQIYSLTCRDVDGGNLYQVAKVFNGLDQIYMIRYTAFKDVVPAAEIEAYTEAVRSSVLIPTKR